MNHLESAHIAFTKGCASKAQRYLRLMRWSRFCDMADFTLCLMALCYRYLGEQQLMLDSLDRPQQIRLRRDREEDTVSTLIINPFTSYVNPSAWIDHAKDMFDMSPKVPPLDFPEFYARMTSSEPT